MARPHQFAALSNTPVAVRAGAVCELQTLDVHNANATGCYVKVYASATAPAAGTVPIGAYWCAQGRTPISVFANCSHLWLAAATEFAAGLSAPAAAVDVTATIEG
jgi:hypothetical protein